MSGSSVDALDGYHDGARPTSQSHFAKFEDFTPNDAASFDHEFARLASSQQWRTIAIKEELELHYFSQPQLDNIDEEEELSEEEIRLRGYQALCQEVGINPSDSVAECKRCLKNTLVNIVDLIDARRTGKRVKVWDSFEEFRAYTLLDEHRIDIREAKRPPGYLASLLQRLSGGPSRKTRNSSRGRLGSKVSAGRITKRRRTECMYATEVHV
ncbi:hypothetical protein N656DRAFT_838529 [Canariomyces notabilis]|uniref:Uncharacterized protein n=1 Tax=Canariomyces notabilis TaxID=2074819 RepID=A0AAN6QL17_9PEZI|nr:hypothetical protein N656DRAFT_838529 [Canariomyces arenarius]